MKEKVVVITGAAAGIGQAVALKFAKEGYKNIVAVDISNQEETKEKLNEYSINPLFIQCDVSNPESVKQMVEQVVDKYGHLDYAFNNAGIMGQHDYLHNLTVDEIQKVIDINLMGVIYCMKYELPEMIKAGGGSIVNTSSANGANGYPMASPYTAAKAGVIGITKTTALEYGRQNITINSVVPGAIQSKMLSEAMLDNPYIEKILSSGNALNRIASLSEIADVVFFLLTSASFVTGHAMYVDGGHLAGVQLPPEE